MRRRIQAMKSTAAVVVVLTSLALAGCSSPDSDPQGEDPPIEPSDPPDANKATTIHDTYDISIGTTTCGVPLIPISCIHNSFSGVSFEVDAPVSRQTFIEVWLNRTDDPLVPTALNFSIEIITSCGPDCRQPLAGPLSQETAGDAHIQGQLTVTDPRDAWIVLYVFGERDPVTGNHAVRPPASYDATWRIAPTGA